MRRRASVNIKSADREENKGFFLITGMEGVGKTNLVLDYVKENYDRYLYIDATSTGDFLSFYEKNDNVSDIGVILSSYFKIDQEYLMNIPVIIDEPCEKIAENLFGDYNGFLKLFVITGDSEKADKIEKNLMAGSVFRVNLNPLDFGEFLTAIDKEWYAEVIEGHLLSKRKIPEMIHEELSDLFELFLQTGGMPEVINEYIRTQETDNIFSKQKFVKYGVLYKSIFSGDCKSRNKVRILWDAIENVLEKSNHKFMYSSIRDGATEREFEEELKFLLSRDLVMQVNRTDCSSDTARGSRYYYKDIAFYERPDRGKVLESLLVQEIKSDRTEVCYWESGKGAVVDLVLKDSNGYIPVELKMNGKSNLRSVRSFLTGMGEKKYICLSDDNCRFEGDVLQVPIYSAYSLYRLL